MFISAHSSKQCSTSPTHKHTDIREYYEGNSRLSVHVGVGVGLATAVGIMSLFSHSERRLKACYICVQIVMCA